MFSDDAVFCAQTESKLGDMCGTFSASCDLFSLQINVKKTVALATNAPPPCIQINDETLKEVDKFCYLCSMIDKSAEAAAHDGKVANIYAELQTWGWCNKYLTIHTKVKIYESCVLPSLLYGSEMWASHTSMEHKLNVFQVHCLGMLSGESWKDKISNEQILECFGTTSLCTILKCCYLHGLGHVSHMNSDWLPQHTLYRELANAEWSRGHPMLPLTDICHQDLKLFGLPTDWEEITDNHQLWMIFTVL